jgi:hypothetical protein
MDTHPAKIVALRQAPVTRATLPTGARREIVVIGGNRIGA